MRMPGPNSYENYFSEPTYYDGHGYAFSSDTFNQQSAEEYFANWLMEEWQWIPREHRKYVYNEVRRNIKNAWVKWHGFIDDDGEMHNGWVLYHDWKGGQKRFRHVYVVDFEKHYIEHGHHFEPIVSDWGMPRSHNDRGCLVCGQLKLAKLEGTRDEIDKIDELIVFEGNQLKVVNTRQQELIKEIGYYDSYK